MTIDEIKQGESDTLEFKREMPSKDSKLLKTIVAFSNGRGGKIVFGVDNRTLDIVGIEASKVFKFMDGLANMISDAIYPQVNPRITFETIDDKTIVIADILPGQNQPYCLKAEGSLDGVYIRVAATTRKAEREKIRELVLLGEGKSYDKLFERHAPASEQAIKNLCKVIELYSHKRSVRLENMLGWGLLKEENGKLFPSIAFRLLAENDLHFARIQCGLFKGTDKVYFLDRKEFDGPLNEQIDNAYNFILQHINIGAEIKGLYRKDVPEIPTEVIRELIVNAVMHRNYLAHSNIQVCIFDDRIEITNPGGLYGGLTLEKMLSGISSIRNELIADIFLKMGIVEKWGTGVKRVRELCKENGLADVEYSADEDFFTVVIRRRQKFPKSSPKVPRKFPEKVPQKSSPKLPETLSEGAVKTFKEIKKNPSASSTEIGKIIGLTSRAVKKHFAILKEHGLIEYVGSQKGGHWIIKDGK
ncbi:ATP-binding protein [Fibrobacter sp.]